MLFAKQYSNISFILSDYAKFIKKMISEASIEKYLRLAVEDLYSRDGYLLSAEHELHEQTITHRLAIYLEQHFSQNSFFKTQELSVDCEYNKNEDDCKRIYGPCMNCQNMCHIKKLNQPFDYNNRRYSTAAEFVRNYHEGKICRSDIVVHHRGKNLPTNTLIVEVKKNSNNKDNAQTIDLIKLSAFTCKQANCQYQYILGCYLKCEPNHAEIFIFGNGTIKKHIKFDALSKIWSSN